MKTLDQIYRYVSDCRFPDDDWQKVLAYCRERFKGGKVHKSLNPKSHSTYDQFIDWIDNGFGSGDMVSYGKTMGIVGDNTPEYTFLVAYCDYEGNLIVQDMKVLDVPRLNHLDEDRCLELKRLMFDKRVDYDIRASKIYELYIPKENYYVILGENEQGEHNVGMYLKSEGCNHYFLAFLSNGKLKMDCWVNAEYTPLKPAGDKDIRRLHKATSNAGWSFNERTKKFVKLSKRGYDNYYWYLNDRFEIVSDIDNGAQKHSDRFKAGNYFVDQTESLLFMKAVRAMVEKE